MTGMYHVSRVRVEYKEHFPGASEEGKGEWKAEVREILRKSVFGRNSQITVIDSFERHGEVESSIGCKRDERSRVCSGE